MDFTQVPVSQGYKYLLVMIDTFTGWIEGFPTQTEKAEEVIKKKKHKNCFFCLFVLFFTTSSAFSVWVGKPSIHPVHVSIMTNTYLYP